MENRNKRAKPFFIDPDDDAATIEEKLNLALAELKAKGHPASILEASDRAAGGPGRPPEDWPEAHYDEYCDLRQSGASEKFAVGWIAGKIGKKDHTVKKAMRGLDDVQTDDFWIALFQFDFARAATYFVGLRPHIRLKLAKQLRSLCLTLRCQLQASDL